MSWATGSVLSRKWQMKVDPFSATGWEMLFAGLGTLHRRPGHRPAASHGAHSRARSRRCCIWSSSDRGRLLGLYLAAQARAHAEGGHLRDVNPVVAVFLGWLVLRERFDAYMFAGTVVIVAGVALVTTAKVHTGEPEQPLGGLPEFESEV